MPRVEYTPPDELPDEYDVLAEERDNLHEDITAEWWNSQGTVRSFGNNPALAKVHVFANVKMWTESGLTPQEVEYVILAVSREIESKYEWQDHVIAAYQQLERFDAPGLSRDEILMISDKDTESMDDSIQALVEYSFELVDTYGAVSDECHDALSEHYDDSTIVGIAMLASYYIFIHHVATALDLDIDEEFVGWNLENI
ncbi:MAG: hypothetical protein PPP58_11125 [Natronomonas sp.]